MDSQEGYTVEAQSTRLRAELEAVEVHSSAKKTRKDNHYNWVIACYMFPVIHECF